MPPGVARVNDIMLCGFSCDEQTRVPARAQIPERGLFILVHLDEKRLSVARPVGNDERDGILCHWDLAYDLRIADDPYRASRSVGKFGPIGRVDPWP